MFLTPGSKATRKRVPTTTGGGSGTPGGVNTDVQYNNSGSFGGDSGLTYLSSVASLGVGNTTNIGSIGIGNATLATQPGLTLTNSDVSWLMYINHAAVGRLTWFDGGSNRLSLSKTTGILNLQGAGLYGFASGGAEQSPQTGLYQDAAAGIIGLANPGTLTNACTFRVYNTVDNIQNTAPTNYERGAFDWTTNTNMLSIGPQAGGTGSLRDMGLYAATKNIWMINSANTKIGSISGAVGQQHHADYGGI